MRIRFKAALTTGVTMVALLGGYPLQAAHAQAVDAQPFSGYTTGTQVSTNLLQIGGTQVANAQEAFAGASANSQGLDNPILNEMGQDVQPALPGKNSYGRGTGLELGLITGFPDAAGLNQLLLSGLAEADAPPPTGVPDPITKTIAVDVPPIVYAALLEGQAQAIFDPTTCVLGQPMSYGKGEAANVQLLPTGPGGPGGLINTGQNPEDNTAKTRSFEYLVPNGDGTFGLVSETRQTLVPIAIGAPAPLIGPPLLVEVDGDFVMRVTATGKPGQPPLQIGGLNDNIHAAIEFSDPLVTISVPNPLVPGGRTPVVGPITMTQLLGMGGINLNLAPIADISVDGAPRSIGSDLTPTPPVIAPDGTSVSAAYDLVQLGVLTGIPGLNGVDLRIGHMENAATVPAGGITCKIPVSKTATPDPVQAGQDVTFTISIPDDPARFATLFACDLINISAVDRHQVLEGNVSFDIVSASNGGIIDGDTVTWPALGNYARGSPPIVLTVVLHVFSGSGVLEDFADVSASLGNCTGGAAGQDIAGQTSFQDAAVSGSVHLVGPQVGRRGALPATGGTMVPLVLGGSLLLVALGVRRFVRRPRPNPVSSQT